MELPSDQREMDYSINPEFYNPDLDDKDELWVRKKMKGRSSDAALNCPACFVTVCLDCQRHAKYILSVGNMCANCKIKNDQILQQREQKQRKACRSIVSEATIFKPVCCSACSLEIRVFDKDEVHHFFTILPSES